MRLFSALVLGLPMLAQVASPIQERATRFLTTVNACTQALSTVAQEAQWKAVTDVKPVHDAASEAAAKALAAFAGNKALIEEARALLAEKEKLTPLMVRQLERVLFAAAEGPMTNPELTARRIAAETTQASALNSFVWKLDGSPITANQIDERLSKSKDLAERLKVWEVSKTNGPALKEGLLKLRDLRNACARELGYANYFDLQMAKHGMTGEEMIALLRSVRKDLEPLYKQLYTWVKHELAKQYRQPVPKAIPAHWINNRWAQNWTGLVAAVDLDLYFKSWEPERIVRTAEAFFVGLGWPKLPASFWTKSDLYPVKAGETRLKNSHASCWHVDLDQDIRSLMSVESNAFWFETAHHELGHGFYQMSYAVPSVPMLLRDSASPAFHEGIAETISLATRQVPYLRALGVLPADAKIDSMQVMLNDALEVAVPFIFWSAGTVPEFEYALYAQNLPGDKLNATWWKLVQDIQGVVPPAPRDESYCDAATKTHINDVPCYYQNYALATVIKYQLHDHACRTILKQPVQAANYAGRKDVGDWLRTFMVKGANEDWRKVIKDATGEDLSTRAMLDYFKPLLAWLERENKGRQIGW